MTKTTPSSSASSSSPNTDSITHPVVTFRPHDFVGYHYVTAGSSSRRNAIRNQYVAKNNQRLGFGGYGTVFECLHKSSQQWRAMKVIPHKRNHTNVRLEKATNNNHKKQDAPGAHGHDKNNFCSLTSLPWNSSQQPPQGAPHVELADHKDPTTHTHKLPHEFVMTQRLDHPTIGRVYEGFSCHTSSQDYLILDVYKGGDLLEAAQSLGRFEEANARQVIYQVLAAVQYCHTTAGIAHMDLKLENVMLVHAINGNDNGNDDAHANSRHYKDIKLIDWGLAMPLEFDDEGQIQPQSKVIGSTPYMSPQLLEVNCEGILEYDPTKNDAWAIGVMTYMLLSGMAPFGGRSDYHVMDSILRHDETTMFDAHDLNKKDQHHHAHHSHHSATEFWNSGVVSDLAKDFVAKLLTYDETKRLSVAQALNHPWMQMARIQQDLEYDNDPHVQNVFRSLLDELVQYGNGTLSCASSSSSSSSPSLPLWKEATGALLTSQYAIPRERQEQVDDLFRVLDRDHCGVLSKDDLCAGLRRFYDTNKNYDAIADRVLERFGTPSSSSDVLVLTYSDFLLATCSESYFLHDEKGLQFAFEVLGCGGDFISCHSLCRAFEGREDAQELAHAMISSLKETKLTGLVSFDEFKTTVLGGEEKRSNNEQQQPQDTIVAPTLESVLPWSQALADSVLETCANSCFSMLEQYMLSHPISESGDGKCSSRSKSNGSNLVEPSCRTAKQSREDIEEGNRSTTTTPPPKRRRVSLLEDSVPNYQDRSPSTTSMASSSAAACSCEFELLPQGEEYRTSSGTDTTMELTMEGVNDSYLFV